jgi:sarcosine oxidase
VTETYDCIVLGVGGFGSGTLYHLARRGARVLGIEQFAVGHDRGSSHGETRIIRKAYFEHPDYVPLLCRAYDLWRDLERKTGRTLLHQAGLFIAGKPDCESVSGTLLAARLHRLPIEKLTPVEAARRFPGHRFPDDFSIVFEPEAGYLEVENCVVAHVEAAARSQAQLRTKETVMHWESDGSQVTVRTDKATYRAASLVITAGPWAGQVLAQLGGKQSGEKMSTSVAVGWQQLFQVVRKPVFWFAAGHKYDRSRSSPTFFYETSAGQFYGFPRIDGRSIKVAEHTEGDPVADPLAVDRDQHANDLARVAAFLRDFLPKIDPDPVRHSVCMYTRTPDCHFCIDRHPKFSNVVIGAGFSGHGFKFTTVLGEALADLALTGKTALPIEFLSVQRLLERR